MMSAMPTAGSAVILTLLVLATSVWAGGVVTTVVVARVATRTLSPAMRVAFFQSFGRAYGIIGPAALAVALVTGAALLRGRPWDGLLAATAAAAALLMTTTGVGMAQARRMTRLRRVALDSPDDPGSAIQVRRGARWAAVLRASIAGFTLVLIVLGSVLAT